MPNPTLYQMVSGGLTSKEHRAQVKGQAKPELDIHKSLDYLGMMPGGAPADILNAGLYGMKGQAGNSLISLLAAIPVIGTVSSKARRAGKLVIKTRGVGGVYPGWKKNIENYYKANPNKLKDYDDILTQAESKSIEFGDDKEGFVKWLKDFNKKMGLEDKIRVPKIKKKGVSKSDDYKFEKGGMELEQKSKIGVDPNFTRRDATNPEGVIANPERVVFEKRRRELERMKPSKSLTQRVTD